MHSMFDQTDQQLFWENKLYFVEYFYCKIYLINFIQEAVRFYCFSDVSQLLWF